MRHSMVSSSRHSCSQGDALSDFLKRFFHVPIELRHQWQSQLRIALRPDRLNRQTDPSGVAIAGAVSEARPPQRRLARLGEIERDFDAFRPNRNVLSGYWSLVDVKPQAGPHQISK